MALAEFEVSPLWLHERGSHLMEPFATYKGRQVRHIGGRLGEWFDECGLFYQVMTQEIDRKIVLTDRKTGRTREFVDSFLEHKLLALEKTILLFQMTWL